MDYLNHFERDEAVMGGETVIRGTRIPLRTVLASLAEGNTPTEIVDAFPSLTEADVQAAIGFAADSAREDIPIGLASPLLP